MHALAVTVVVPTRNRWPMLRLALESALRQEDVDHEVVVVDDGSTDETPARLAELERSSDRLEVVRNERGSGVARARNAGIARARGDWIAFLDDDDVWSPRKLRAQLDASTPGSVLVYGTYVALDARRRPIRVAPAPEPADVARRLLRTNPIGGPSTFMVRAEVVRRLGGFDDDLAALADWDLLLRAVREGPPARCRDVVVGYVEHGANMMVADEARITEEFERLRAKHAAAAAAEGVEFGDLWLLSWGALRARRAGGRLAAASFYGRRAVRTRAPKDFARTLGALAGEGLTQRIRRLLGLRARGLDWLRPFR